MKPDVGKFAAMLLHAATTAHILHLKTSSYAEHKALQGLYEGIPDLIDQWIEAYQGLYGIIETYPSGYEPPKKDCVETIREIAADVREMRKKMPENTELQNIIDEIAALIDSTLYKLRFLK